jgi:hypothetical protein
MKQLDRPLTDTEIDWLARMLLMLAELPADRRIAITALACKIGFIDDESWRYKMLRLKAGLEKTWPVSASPLGG